MNKRVKFTKRLKANWQLLVMFSIPLVWVLIFCYVPIVGGMIISFKDFNLAAGIFESEWVGFKHYTNFFTSFRFWRVIKNTVVISVYYLLASTPPPIILALCLNYLKNKRAKKVVQMMTYAPYFISSVVIVGIINQLFSSSVGPINTIITSLGGSRINFLGNADLFIHLFVWSGVWQVTGYTAIIYISALSSIDQEQYEAASIDGASPLQKIRYIDVPGIMPSVIVMFILNLGSSLNFGYEKIYLMQNATNLKVSEVIATYVYKVGINALIPQYSYSTAIGLFIAIISTILVVGSNKISSYLGETALW